MRDYDDNGAGKWVSILGFVAGIFLYSKVVRPTIIDYHAGTVSFLLFAIGVFLRVKFADAAIRGLVLWLSIGFWLSSVFTGFFEI